MKKVLFLIHDLGQGGAEKVLVNLVNHMDKTKYEITVTALFGGGVNEQFLNKDIHYHAIFQNTFRGNSQIFKLFTPVQLHRFCVKEEYDIEISYLEGPCARIISGCENPATKLISWIHIELKDMKSLQYAFRSEAEARRCYSRFDQIVCVSQDVKEHFCKLIDLSSRCRVLYNTVETELILQKSLESTEFLPDDGAVNLIAVGSLTKNKGYLRLFEIVKRLHTDGYNFRLFVLGKGPLKEHLNKYILDNALADTIIILGYDTNPYKYIARCDLLVCASYAEGFSTAATEALILGTPVCTVQVSGMRELFGDSECGIITENNDECLEEGLRYLLDNNYLLKDMSRNARKRSMCFSTEQTVLEVETMFEGLINS